MVKNIPPSLTGRSIQKMFTEFLTCLWEGSTENKYEVGQLHIFLMFINILLLYIIIYKC